jgi:hypothetical protein
MSSISSGITTTTALVQTADTSGILQFQTNGTTTAVTIDTAQNVGLGVTPSAWGSGYKTIQNPAGYIGSYSTGAVLIGQNYYDSGVGAYKYIYSNYASQYVLNNGQHQWFNAPSGTAGNAITFTQAMTLDASGHLIVGATAIVGGSAKGSFQSSGANVDTIETNSTSGSPYYAVHLYSSGSGVGGLYYNGTTTVVLATSDPRLKDITGPVTNSGEFIDALKPVTGTWKSNGSSFTGFLTSDYQELDPISVVGEVNAIDKNNNPIYQQMEYGSAKWCAMVSAELQSLRKRLAILEAKG